MIASIFQTRPSALHGCYRFRLLACVFLLAPALSFAQSERKLIREGNKLYESKKFSDAEVVYRKSLEKNKGSFAGNYDLGNAYYKQQKFDEAQSQFQKSLESKDLSKADKSKIYHNLGNTLLEAKKYPESIEAYKHALRMNSKDNDTRYNLAYAQQMLQQQQQQQKQDQNKDDKKDQDKKKQDQQSKQQKEKEDKKQDPQQAKDRRQNISKEDAEKMLQALNNDEKNTQKKLVKKETTRIQIEKQW